MIAPAIGAMVISVVADFTVLACEGFVAAAVVYAALRLLEIGYIGYKSQPKNEAPNAVPTFQPNFK